MKPSGPSSRCSRPLRVPVPRPSSVVRIPVLPRVTRSVPLVILYGAASSAVSARAASGAANTAADPARNWRREMSDMRIPFLRWGLSLPVHPFPSTRSRRPGKASCDGLARGFGRPSGASGPKRASGLPGGRRSRRSGHGSIKSGQIQLLLYIRQGGRPSATWVIPAVPAADLLDCLTSFVVTRFIGSGRGRT